MCWWRTVSYGRSMAQTTAGASSGTTVRSDASWPATTVRALGLGLTGLLSIGSGAGLAALLLGTYADPDAVGPLVLVVLATAVLATYVVVAPPTFAQRTRATSTGTTGARLGAAVGGYVVVWSVLAAALSLL